MPENQNVVAEEVVKSTDELVADYLTNNPHLAAALATFDVAQEEYRRSLLALTSVRIVVSGTTNLEA
jgi:hypothetical protein